MTDSGTTVRVRGDAYYAGGIQPGAVGVPFKITISQSAEPKDEPDEPAPPDSPPSDWRDHLRLRRKKKKDRRKGSKEKEREKEKDEKDEKDKESTEEVEVPKEKTERRKKKGKEPKEKEERDKESTEEQAEREETPKEKRKKKSREHRDRDKPKEPESDTLQSPRDNSSSSSSITPNGSTVIFSADDPPLGDAEPLGKPNPTPPIAVTRSSSEPAGIHVTSTSLSAPYCTVATSITTSTSAPTASPSAVPAPSPSPSPAGSLAVPPPITGGPSEPDLSLSVPTASPRSGYTSDQPAGFRERVKAKFSRKKKEKSKTSERHHQPTSMSAEFKPTMIACVNPKSGSQRGSELIPLLQKILGAENVWDLSTGSPSNLFDKHRDTPALRVIAAGGDGTVRWVIQCIIDAKFDPPPLVGILPLGTGNDLSREFGWGMAYTPKERDIAAMIDKLRVARAKPLDIWKVRNRSMSQTATQIMFNYFNIGFDAQVQLGFHEKRSESPELFKARLINKWVYAWYGLENVIRGTLDLSSVLRLRVDDKDIIIPAEVRTLIFLNFTCYQNGVDIWGPPTETDQRRPRMDDGMIEVVGLRGFNHEALARLEITHGLRLAQGSRVILTTNRTDQPFPVAYDGEPCLQMVEWIEIKRWGQIHILSNPDLEKPKKGTGFLFFTPP
jgi:diacylglycerol kinase (ATP)